MSTLTFTGVSKSYGPQDVLRGTTFFVGPGRKVALVGVEPPSVADVNSVEELTVVHRILLGGNVVIVEGLAHLDQLRREVVEFIALPLKIVGGDGCPVRAIAIENA